MKKFLITNAVILTAAAVAMVLMGEVNNLGEAKTKLENVVANFI